MFSLSVRKPKLEATLGGEHHRALLRPSTMYDTLVMNGALSDARNAMVWAISPGLPIGLSCTVAAGPAFLSATTDLRGIRWPFTPALPTLFHDAPFEWLKRSRRGQQATTVFSTPEGVTSDA